MSNKRVSKYVVARWHYRRYTRLLFSSPAELAVIEIMGGRIYRAPYIRHPKTKFSLSYGRLGKYLKKERIKREVRVGKYCVDFGNDIKRAIEIDGYPFHRNVVAEFERDSYLYQRGWKVLHITAALVRKNPELVKHKIKTFLES